MFELSLADADLIFCFLSSISKLSWDVYAKARICAGRLSSEIVKEMMIGLVMKSDDSRI